MLTFSVVVLGHQILTPRVPPGGPAANQTRPFHIQIPRTRLDIIEYVEHGPPMLGETIDCLSTVVRRDSYRTNTPSFLAGVQHSPESRPSNVIGQFSLVFNTPSHLESQISNLDCPICLLLESPFALSSPECQPDFCSAAL